MIESTGGAAASPDVNSEAREHGRRLFRHVFWDGFQQTALVVIGIVAVWAGLREVFSKLYIEETVGELADQISIVIGAGHHDKRLGDASFCRRIASMTRMRLTIVNRAGHVVCDSIKDAAVLESHADRQEIIAAFRDGSGTSQRKSHSVGYDMIYRAVRSPDGKYVVRGSLALDPIEQALHTYDIATGLLASALAVLLVGLSVRTARRLAIQKERVIAEMRRNERMRMEFVANVSHELRTPLTSVRGYAETLRHDLVDAVPESSRHAQIVVNATDRLLKLVERLLQLARLESGVFDAKPEQIDLRTLTADVASRMNPLFAAKRQRVECRYDVETLWADPSLLDHVLTNLLENARVHSPDASVIRVEWRRCDDERVELWVEDSGVGVAAEHRDRVFERFYRVDSGRARKDGGSGLGLAIVKHAMMLSGGSARVESSVDGGARFVCRWNADQESPASL